MLKVNFNYNYNHKKAIYNKAIYRLLHRRLQITHIACQFIKFIIVIMSLIYYPIALKQKKWLGKSICTAKIR